MLIAFREPVLGIFLEHFTQTLHSNHLIFLVCCFIQTPYTTDNKIGRSGAESVYRALQSNTSLISLKIFRVLFLFSPFHTQSDNKFGLSLAKDLSRAAHAAHWRR